MVDDPVIEFVRKTAGQFPAVEKIILFGSRAQGTAHERSDYDFAVWLSDQRPDADSQWGRLSSLLREQNPRLNTLDLVRMDMISPEFKAKILSQGKVIYDKI